jgi:hypothetical protein
MYSNAVYIFTKLFFFFCYVTSLSLTFSYCGYKPIVANDNKQDEDFTEIIDNAVSDSRNVDHISKDLK